MSAHEVILASAGTGKTYQLTNRFLRLICSGVAPERILATTFTRKAAGEVLDRVLERLAEAAASSEKAAALSEALELDGCDQAFFRQQLAQLLKNLDRLHIRTLDSLFVRWVQLFSWELGMPAAWRVGHEREDEALRSEAVTALLEHATRQEFLDLLQQLHGDQFHREAHGALLQQAREVYKAWRETDDESAWAWIEPPPSLSASDLEVQIAFLAGAEAPPTKAGHPNKKFANGLVTANAHMRDADWKTFLTSTLVRNARPDGSGKYQSCPIDPPLADCLMKLADHALHHILRQLDARNRASFSAMQKYHEISEARKRTLRQYQFDDLPQQLAHADGLDTRALAYRLGLSADHLLLDEFQDTSVTQWRALKPLAEPLLQDTSGQRSFFCVGDVKQAIYAWRSGEWRLLHQLANRPETADSTLERSWRSSQAVLTAVNDVFTGLQDNALFADEPDLHPALAQWDADYKAHEAALDKAGAVRVWRTGDALADNASAELELTARLAADRVKERPHESVGILLRRRKSIGWLLYRLRQMGVRASGEGGNPLTDSECVLAALSIFHLADHPGDTAAAFHLRHSAFGAALDLGSSPASRRAVSRSLRTRIASAGYGQLLQDLRPATSDYDAWNQRRYAQLIALADQYDRRASLRPSEFAAFVHAERVEDPSSSDVRIMTIHASKGLQFDTVILPDLDSTFADKPDKPWRLRPDPEGPVTRVSHDISKEISKLHPGLHALHQEVRGRKLQEDLCLLYVAMTRAVHDLELVLPPERSKGGFGFTHAALVHSALLGDDEPEPRGDGVVLAERIVAGKRDERSADEVPVAKPVSIKLQPSKRPRQLPRVAPSGLEGGGRVKPDLWFSNEARHKRQRGTFMHACLEDIVWLDGPPAFDRWQVHAATLGVPEATAREWVAQLKPWMDGNAVAAALRPERYERAAGDLEVWREKRFAVLSTSDAGESTLLEGSFDRVVLTLEAGAPVRAEIVDYKTDQIASEADVERLVAEYQPQLAAYRDAVCVMTGLAPAAITGSLLFLSANRVAPVALD